MYLLSTQTVSTISTEEDLYKTITQNNEGCGFTETKQNYPQCFICCDKQCDVRCIVRSCLCSASPCEGHICNCHSPYNVCSKCITRQLWQTSNPLMQKQLIFRARCAFCKAEFCKDDIVLLPKLIVNDPPQEEKLQPQTTATKRKKRNDNDNKNKNKNKKKTPC